MSNSKETQIEILKYILYRTRKANKKLETLDDRLKTILEKMNHPVDGISYKQTTGGSGNNDGAAEIPLRADEIESRIRRQRQVLADCIIQGMRVLDELDATSDEHAILSAYYIYSEGYESIAKRFSLDISTVWRKMRSGYEKLIQTEWIQQMLAETEAEWRESL